MMNEFIQWASIEMENGFTQGQALLIVILSFVSLFYMLLTSRPIKNFKK